MCGIVGIVSSNTRNLHKITEATQTLSKRGPDNQSTHQLSNMALGHARLSIIDLSAEANQPFLDHSERYVMVFNGEIYNYKELREELLQGGFRFSTDGDTEVLLNLYIKYGKECVKKLNGFFAFCIYDKQEDVLFMARDRMGIKPFLYYQDEEQFIFASELKALMRFDIDKEIDEVSLFNYFQFNYIPTNNSILKKVKKLESGHFIFIKDVTQLKFLKEELSEESYYSISASTENGDRDYKESQIKLYELLEDSVKKRLVADVPVGAFLSGGVDSSVVSLLAKKHKKDLRTFSIGYKEEPYFDETAYAKAVANKIGSDHLTFSLSNSELYAHLQEVLDYIDEPFADSSAIAVYILSKYTKEHVKVILSGDGADEMFSGYNKHLAEYKALHPGWKENVVKLGYPLWSSIPKSRNSRFMDINRKLFKYSSGARLDARSRYWKWASILDENKVEALLKKEVDGNSAEYNGRKADCLKHLTAQGNINDVLRTDMRMVLKNDMLRKVDMMSMANGLEVRTPFLDHQLVDYAFSLPAHFKINGKMKKRILQDAFRESLPKEVYNRPKHGFEVPLLRWFQNELRPIIEQDLLQDDFIENQGIFHVPAVQKLKRQLFSSNPGDVPATIWALIVFNSWWKKYFC